MTTLDTPSASLPIATTDARFLGFFNAEGDDVKWTPIGCTLSKEFYQESSKYFGCSTLYTGCTVEAPSSTSALRMQYCTREGYVCVTQTLHSTYPAPTFDQAEMIKPLCVTSGYYVRDLYKVSPTPTAASSSVLSSTTSSSSTASPTIVPAAPSPQPLNKGVIAGATVGGVAALLILASLIWFFGSRRRKSREQDVAEQQAQGLENEKDRQSIYEMYGSPYTHEVDGLPRTHEVAGTPGGYEVDGTSHAQELSGGYTPVEQDPPDTWRSSDSNESGEPPIGTPGRRG